MGEGKFYSGGELIDIALSNSAGSEAGKEAITIDNPDEVLPGEIQPLYLVGELNPVPDVIFYDEETDIWTDNDGNDLGLADFDYDENYTYEVEATAGDTVTVICVTPQSGAAPGYFKLTAIGSLQIEDTTVTLEEFVTELNAQSDMTAIGVAAVSGDDIAITPSQQFTQILAALEQGGAQAEAVQTYWAQFKAALLKISNDAANAVDPDPSVNVIYNNSTVFSANAGTITYNKYN